jgi:hypothetical protein
MKLRLAALALLAFAFACSSKPQSRFGDGGPTTSDDDAGPMEPVDPFADSGLTGDGGTIPTCVPDPLNFDVPNNGCDDDGDGMVDNPPACDTNSPVTGDAYEFAKALGLCQRSTGSDNQWGVISAEYSTSFAGTTAPGALQHGILSKFGNKIVPRQGAKLGMLSSGAAREYNDESCGWGFGGCGSQCSFKSDSCMFNVSGSVPPGFPKPAQGCSVSSVVKDVAALKLKIRVPKNAKGLAFDFDFYSAEWPNFVCSNYNDGFIAYLRSSAFNNGTADNISFDSKNNPVSVNNGFFDRCSPMNFTTCGSGGPKPAPCGGGDAELQGTGFYNPDMNCYSSGMTDSGGGATGWLTTKAPVAPGETIDLHFYVFDVGDDILDSAVLLDKFEWQATDTGTGTVRPPN